MSGLLSDEQRIDWLQLIRSENVGPRTFRTLVNKFGGAGLALAALPDLLKQAKGAKTIKIFSRDEARREMDLALAHGVRFIALGEADYPRALRAIDSPPPLLAVKGSVAVLAQPAVAIVGSRNASTAGLAMAERLARGLGKEGFATISGLARGVDGAVHRASLRSGTVAALAGGHLRLYPADHVSLADEIVERGALVSEMPLEWEPRGRDFPRRNRIVAGMGLGTVVVEAARRSGSLITARFAMEQGREVFSVPGSPLDPRAEGTNDLLRQGAILCTEAANVTTALAPMLAGGKPRNDLFSEDFAAPAVAPLWDESDLFADLSVAIPSTPLDFEMNEASVPYQAYDDIREDDFISPTDPVAAVMALLSPSPVSIDDLTRTARLPAAVISMALIELEMRGQLERHGGNRVSLVVRKH